MSRVQASARLLPVTGPRDSTIDRARALAEKAAQGALPALIEGEPGTGKATLARSIHSRSDRATRPLVVVDAAALAWDRATPALFGLHRTGAATEAGKLREAQGGTLVIEEIEALPPDAQARLMRFLDSGEIEPQGARRVERLNVRVLATSSQRLLDLVKVGDFSEELYYRLSVLPIYLPPLRDRPGEIADLVVELTRRFARELDKPVDGLLPETVALLERFPWPGNLRQLENAVFRAVALCEGDRLAPVDFPQVQIALEGRSVAIDAATRLASSPVQPAPAIARFKHKEGPAAADRFLTADGEVKPLTGLERELIAFAISHYRGRMSKVARALGIGRSTLYRKLRDYGLSGGIHPDAA